MQRVVSIWLPYWKTDRIEARAKAGADLHDPAGKPFAVIAKGKGGKRIAGLNRCARDAGLRVGMLVTDACAIVPGLEAAAYDQRAEWRELKRLAATMTRFSPWTAPDESDGLWIEATGLAHLFGGEEVMLDMIIHHLRRLGYAARGAMASTPGAAWAMARGSRKTPVVVPPGEEAHALASLPVKALRLDAEGVALLKRVGLKTIGQLYDIPRANLRARLGKTVTGRLDQALGRQGEAISPLLPEPVYAARLEFIDPLTAREGLEETGRILIESVTASLAADGKGACRFNLVLFDTRSGKAEIRFQMAQPSAEPKHITRVLKERLGVLEGRFDPNPSRFRKSVQRFSDKNLRQNKNLSRRSVGEAAQVCLGFDAVTLYALGAEPLVSRQTDLLGPALDRSKAAQEKVAQFLNRVTARLGAKAARRGSFNERYWPERASANVPAASSAADAAPKAPALPRPLLLLPRPEPIDTIALVPDYPPRKFTWRRCRHIVTRAEGPERISPEWRQDEKAPPARDYYVVENEDGQRFWLYREGVYGKTRDQRWFMHGLFS